MYSVFAAWRYSKYALSRKSSPEDGGRGGRLLTITGCSPSKLGWIEFVSGCLHRTVQQHTGFWRRPSSTGLQEEVYIWRRGGNKDDQLPYENDLKRAMFSSIDRVTAEIRETFQQLQNLAQKICFFKA
ncbi:hypothetical protein TNCV_1548241 [Trichonephila clavipes]|nr:hypothetical protein TNCV_1548241 [Trichonephila clavipes]